MLILGIINLPAMKHYLIAAITLLSLSACGGRDDIEIGGKGGNATLNITMGHDGNYAKDGTIYIKYNADDMPSEMRYDDSAKCKDMGDGKPVAVFTGLKKGKYYLFGSGYDPIHADNIKGGAKYTITEETSLFYNLKTAH